MAQTIESWAAEQGTEYGKEPIGHTAQDGANQSGGKLYPMDTEEYHMVETWKKLLWHGGSVYDAWLNAASAQVGQVILTLPYALAQLGYIAGIGFQIFYAALGCWTAYLLCCLLSEYRSRMERKGEKLRDGHVTQYHEVMASLVGSWAGYLSLLFNVISLLGLGVVQIIACASNVYYMNNSLNKRSWEIIFGGIALLTVLIPTFHNYRIWSFLGLLATTYTSWYMTAAALRHGQVENVQHLPYTSLAGFFTGSTNILFAFGGHSITVEIMHAMWRPRKFGWVYIAACLYTFTLTMPNSISVYWAYGDIMLNESNALGVLPPSTYRDIAIILMIIHQCVAFGLFVTPLFLMWEKVVGVHHTKVYALRAVARIPVVLLIWFLAVAFPFFGPINSIIGAFSTTFSTYLIPSLMYMIVYRTAAAREACSQEPPTWIGRSFRVAYAFNIIVFISVLVMGVGFGAWASLSTFIQNFNTYGIFEKCYQCPAIKKV